MVDALCQTCDCWEKSEPLPFLRRPHQFSNYLNLGIFFLIKSTEQFGMIFAFIITWKNKKSREFMSCLKKLSS